MSKPTVAIGNDHAGTDLKERIINEYSSQFEFINHGTNGSSSVDYPDYVHPVAQDVESEKAIFGILICGSANGVCMTANKHKGIRAGLAWNKEVAKLIKQHNNANIICLPARFLEEDEALEVLQTYVDEKFEGGRHQNRINKIAVSNNE
ncbi:RpiB/LacA/LacB family sugar-phosphate isomerase [Bacteroidia bacterium]|nr:RpiB/LacA/LacB family sugar-phosphate isomerase [Bacteroidia bacterium]MDC1395051.1 RpiB/LacA/LacB family sugar-phosphate isomerase [Bacteroidia bacterium]